MFCKLHLIHVKTNNIQNIIGGFLFFNTSCERGQRPLWQFLFGLYFFKMAAALFGFSISRRKTFKSTIHDPSFHFEDKILFIVLHYRHFKVKVIIVQLKIEMEIILYLFVNFSYFLLFIRFYLRQINLLLCICLETLFI